MADLPFKAVAVTQRKHSSALPGKPGSSMYVSMLYVDRVHKQFLGFSALRLAVEYSHASLGFIPVIKRFTAPGRDCVYWFTCRLVWRGLIGVKFCFRVKP